MKTRLCLGVIGFLALSSLGRAQKTMATFSDPSSGNEILFDWDMTANTLTGSWKTTGLDLLTPGFNGGGQINDAMFTTSVIPLAEVVPGVLYTMGAGSVTFTDSANVVAMVITFDSGLFQNPLTTGAASAQGNNVDFVGPNVPGPLTDESFSFSLANPTQVGDHMMFTASFTSSATVVPEPASLVALGAGLLAVMRRRRQR